MLSLHRLTVSIGKKTILRDISYDFEEGKVYAVMGPNGSGKSTLAYSIMGHPEYEMPSYSKVTFNGRNIKEDSADKRSQAGIFLSFQSPLSLSGVRISELLQLALLGKKDPLVIRKEIQSYARKLKVSEELLSRSLNEGASGGEKKKLEVLQAAVLDKKLMVFDEIDTGVDVDALRVIAKFLHDTRSKKTYIVITHYNRILRYLKPDKVLVVIGGRLKKVGSYTLAEKIEKKGYAAI